MKSIHSKFLKKQVNKNVGFLSKVNKKCHTEYFYHKSTLVLLFTHYSHYGLDQLHIRVENT